MSLKLLSLNVNGLRDPQKRITLFDQLLQGPFDIIFLQETHHASSSEAQSWLQTGAGPGRPLQWDSHWSHGSASSRGTGILIHPRAEFQIQGEAVTDRAGRVVRVDGTIQDRPLTLVNVYAPCECDQRAAFFLTTLHPMLPRDVPVCVGGDFNCISEPRDQQGCTTQGRLTGYQGGLEVVQDSLDLVDAWRHQHPTAIGFTHVGSSGSTGRLDRWLVSSQLLDRVQRTRIETAAGLPGDHLPVSIVLKPAIHLPRGPGVWGFPAHLLDQPELCTLISSTITTHSTSFATESATPAADCWEALKRRIRDVTQQYSFKAASSRRKQRTLWQQKMARAAAALAINPEDPTVVQQWHDAQQELQALHTHTARQAALRAGVLWQDFGEQSTFWFHRMGQLRRNRTTITTLLADPSIPESEFPLTTPAARTKAAQIISSYYSGDSPTGLFRLYPTDAAAQDTLLDSIDRQITPEPADGSQNAAEEGTFTAAELDAALSATANNKRPGPDGLPYEFFKCFWSLLQPLLLNVCAETFLDPEGHLPESMTAGVVALLYKEQGSKLDLKNYRPITLLNADYKLIAKALANRLAEPLSQILEPTQSAFLPNRWIGDNILDHLEEVEYLSAGDQPGCILFLDFEKAFDRVNRDWIQRCLQRLGFGASMQRWVSIMHSHTSVQVMYNGWRTNTMPLHSGVFQGSPLSPLLFNIAVQPLASYLRRLHDSGRFSGITLPDGTTAPVTQQHADDTTIHARTLADARVALDEGVELYCIATGAKLNREKSKGFAFHQPHTPGAADPTTGVQLVDHEDHIRHLGILISPSNPTLASASMFARIKRGIAARIAHWSAQHLSPLGRMHIAKQVLASMLYHHATFIPPDPQTLQSITTMIDTFVTPLGRYHPRKSITCLPQVDGGMKAVHVPVMLQALHAKIWTRLCLPGPAMWKTLLHARLRSSTQGVWNLGSFAPLSVMPPGRFALPFRTTTYMRAFKSLAFHRTTSPPAPTPPQMLLEKLFYNRRILDSAGNPLGGAEWKPLAQAGVTTVLHLTQARANTITIAPQARALCAAIQLPPEWESALQGHTAGALLLPWRLLSPSTVGDFSANPPRSYAIGINGTLKPCASPLPTPSAQDLPAAVVYHPACTAPASDPPAPPPAPIYLGLASHIHLHPSTWSFGAYPLAAFVVHRAATRLLRLDALRGTPYQPGQGVKPRTWQEGATGTGHQLADLEERWHALYTARLEEHQAGRRRRRPPDPGDLEDVYHVGWMDPPAPRQHWRDRQLARQEAAPDTPEDSRSSSTTLDDDIKDLLAPAAGPAPRSKDVWNRLHTFSLPRPVLFANWITLHAALHFGAPRLRTSPPDADPTMFQCPHPCCDATLQTISHVFVSCPIAVRTLDWVWKLWRAIAGAAPPPPSTQLLVVGDPEAWAPGDSLAWLWHKLRCHTVHALWESAAQRREAGDQAAETRQSTGAATAVIARLIAALRSELRRDWMRSQEDPRMGLPGTYSSWFRGRDPCISMADFTGRWCHGGTLCSISTELGTPSLHVKLSFASAH